MTSKMQLVDSNGLPVRLALSPGRARDLRLAGKRLSSLESRSMLLADRAYDADSIRELTRKKGAWTNIPPKSNRNVSICFSPCLYRARNLLEQFFNKITQCRWVGDALRQAGNELACFRSARLDQAMAALMGPRPNSDCPWSNRSESCLKACHRQPRNRDGPNHRPRPAGPL